MQLEEAEDRRQAEDRWTVTSDARVVQGRPSAGKAVGARAAQQDDVVERKPPSR